MSKDDKKYWVNLLGTDSHVEARNQLLLGNLGLVSSSVAKFNNIGVDFEDRLSMGIVFAIRAIDTFDNSKGFQLSTYISSCIYKGMCNYIRDDSSYVNETPIDLIEEGADHVKYFSDNRDSTCDIAILSVAQEEFITMMSCLKDREKRVIMLRYGFVTGDNMKYKEVSEVMGESVANLNRIEKIALRKIRERLEGKKNGEQE